jgi:hypothetical protein
MSLNYTFYHDSSAGSSYPSPQLATPRQSRLHQSRASGRGVRILDAITPMSAPSQTQSRQISLTPDSSSHAHLEVFDTEGNVLAVLNPGVRKSPLRGRADIGAVVVTLDGESRTCDMAPSLEWIDTATHIGVSVQTKNGSPTCTLNDMSTGISMPDVWGTVPGQRCVYVTDQRGHSGLQCS